MTDPNPSELQPLPAEIAVARLTALFGGYAGIKENMNRRHAAFQEVWQQDSLDLGQVLHAHLVVEFFLTEYLQRLHPTLNLDQLRLRYEQKVGMIPSSDAQLTDMKPGLKALGTIRNRMAHVRRVQISKDDIQAIVGIVMYAAFTHAGGTFKLAHASPKEVVMNFAQWAAGTLHAAADPAQDKWAIALDPTKEVAGYERFLTPSLSDGMPGVGRRSALFGDT